MAQLTAIISSKLSLFSSRVDPQAEGLLSFTLSTLLHMNAAVIAAKRQCICSYYLAYSSSDLHPAESPLMCHFLLQLFNLPRSVGSSPPLHELQLQQSRSNLLSGCRHEPPPQHQTDWQVDAAVLRLHSRRCTCLEFHPLRDHLVLSGDKKGQVGLCMSLRVLVIDCIAG